MTVTILCGAAATTIAEAGIEGESLWLAPDDLARATGWQWTPEGLCRGSACVPVPRGDAGREWVRETGGRPSVSLTRLAQHLGQPVVASAEHRVWAVGEAAEEVGERLRSLEAPDFTLPDLNGRRHTLSDYRGRKVFLLVWASW
jgi:hypothetical protein